MARSWGEFLGDTDTSDETPDEQSGFLSRLRDSLGKSRRALTEQIAAAAFDPGDDEAWERLEEALIAADVGVPTTAELVQRLEAREVAGELGAALSDEATELLGGPPRIDLSAEPTLILVVGVNGTGKTTTIGKLAQSLASTITCAPGRRRHVRAPRPKSSSRSGPAAPARTSLGPSAGGTPLRSPTTRSRPRRLEDAAS
jgi:fused signal recognition particle receptor